MTEVLLSDSYPILNFAPLHNLVHIDNEQERREHTSLPKSTTHPESLRYLSANPNATSAIIVQRLDGPQKLTRNPVLLQTLPQLSSGNPVICLLEIHKTHVDLLS